MNRLFYFMLIISSILLIGCSKEKNYKVSFQSKTIYVTMKCPSIGIVGINQISYDGFELEDIEKDIFEEIRDRDYSGNYDVYVTLQFKDEYGNYNDSPESVKICTLNGKDVKKYVSYSYFRGKIPFHYSYPWIHDYNVKDDSQEQDQEALEIQKQKKKYKEDIAKYVRLDYYGYDWSLSITNNTDYTIENVTVSYEFSYFDTNELAHKELPGIDAHTFTYIPAHSKQTFFPKSKYKEIKDSYIRDAKIISIRCSALDLE